MEAKDPQGNVISNFNEDVTLSVASSQGPGTLYGTFTVAADAGVATFTDVSLEQAGSGYTITAAYAGISSATSNSISVTAAPATKLSIASQPTTSVTGNTEFEVDVSAIDPYGNVDQSFTQPLTIGILTGPTGAVLGGTKTVNAVDGVAAFPDLTLATAFTGYTLRATGSTGFAATTTPFTVTPTAALEFATSSESVDETTGSATIEVERASGYQGAVSVNIGTSGGTAVAGTNYTAVNTTLNFPAGQNDETVTIPLLNAGLIPDLTVNVVLSSPGSGAALGSPSSNTLTIHRPPPAQPAAPVLLAADDSGTKGDGITDDQSPNLSGTAEPGAKVQLLNYLNAVVGSTTAATSGKYLLPVPGAPLGPSTDSFRVVAMNSYGSSAASLPFSLTIVAAPSVPSRRSSCHRKATARRGGDYDIHQP